MKNKIIQENRMKGYFIQAAKDILKGEGVKSISVRSIADQAGYSYATLYNYFKDIKDLFFECIKDFQDECEEFVVNESKSEQRGIEKIKAISRAYARYFVQYPGIFELFFIEKITDIESKKPTSDLICSFLDNLCSEEWEYCIKKDNISIIQVESMRNTLRYQIPGLLLFYINRRNPSDYKDFITLLDKQLDRILHIDSSVKKGKLFEKESLNFIFENEKNLVTFIHYTKEEKVANQIFKEGFKYTESFYNTVQQVINDKHDMSYKHNIYKYYGPYIIVISISSEIYNFYSDELKKNSKVLSQVENILSEQPPSLNENSDMVYLLPTQFIKGYINHETGRIEKNPNYNPNYNPSIFSDNIQKIKSK
ncbi:MAG: TetR/AcrR family transcriptional regulator [Tenuifilaceae bacterium]